MHFLGEHVFISGDPKPHTLFIQYAILVEMRFIGEPHIMHCDFFMVCPHSKLQSVRTGKEFL